MDSAQNVNIASPWLLNQRDDLLFIVLIPLLSVVLVGLFFLLNVGFEQSADQIARSYFFVYIVFFDNPHILQTFSRTHFDAAERRRHRIVHFAVLPVLILAAVLWPKFVDALWFQSFFAVFGLYHIYAQNVGFLKLYGRKVITPERVRRTERFFYFALFNAYLTKVGMADLLPHTEDLDTFGPWIFQGLSVINRAMLVLALGAAVVLVQEWYKLFKTGVSFFNPRWLLFVCLSLSYSVNYWVLGVVPVLAMQVFDTLYHDIQYLRWIAHYQSRRFAFSRIVLKWGVGCLLLSLLFHFGEPLFGTLGWSVPLASIFIMLTVYHYFVDGLVWKFRTQSELGVLSQSPPRVVPPLAA